MRTCPACGAERIPEHSVLVSIDAIGPGADLQSLQTFARCTGCGGVFGVDGPDTLTPAPKDALGARELWVVPPWVSQSHRSEFAMSWDVVESFFEQMAVDSAWLRPLCEFIESMRHAGFDERLRAGQSLTTLGLSRSRTHGLREGQSALWIRPQGDGRVQLEGSIGVRRVELGPREATLSGELRAEIEALAGLPVD